jgi:hypothetical protein
MEKLCTNKNRSYKHNEQINKQNIDNAECFGIKFVLFYSEGPISETVYIDIILNTIIER